jgi:hypothetical protein
VEGQDKAREAERVKELEQEREARALRDRDHGHEL